MERNLTDGMGTERALADDMGTDRALTDDTGTERAFWREIPMDYIKACINKRHLTKP